MASIHRRIRSKVFDIRCRNILATPPVNTTSGPILTISMVSHSDVIRYIIAAKSFHQSITDSQFWIIDDGTLTSDDCRIINSHIKPIHIEPASEIQNAFCPRNGTWERLIRIVSMTPDHFVIQLDSDTVTLNTLPEVVNAIKSNTSFTLGTAQNETVRELQFFSHSANPSTHIQIKAERALKHVANGLGTRYVRGCSAFAGFAMGSFSLDALQEFSERMFGQLGVGWKEWGSEQVASNFLIANAHGATVLPYPSYASFDPHLRTEQCRFIHFIGTYRYHRGAYARIARSIIPNLGRVVPG